MLDKILVPLDGSELAESAIPYVRDLVEQLGADVYLLHACPPEHSCYLHMHQMYMNSLADGLRQEIKSGGKDIKIQSEVILGEATKIIFDYVKLKEISLVVMTSHGVSGFRPFAMGSIADKIVRGVGIPTLLIRVKSGQPPAERKAIIRKILLPLDNSDAGKISIPYAVQLAKKLNASISLFSMAQTIYSRNLDVTGTGGGAGLGVNWDAIDEATRKGAEEYLQGIEDEIRQSGIEANHSAYIGVDAAYEILEMEKKTQADLVVMATRGRSPVARWALGSVTEKVLREGDKPILLVQEKGQLHS